MLRSLKAPTTKTVASGFSLLEIVLALGVVAFAIIPMVGLLAVGVAGIGEANADMRTALIAQAERAKVSAARYSDLPEGLMSRSYYDAEGMLLSASDQEAVFEVETRVTKGGAFLDSANLAKIDLIITGSALRGMTKRYSFWITNFGE